jgi:hypothetical protein
LRRDASGAPPTPTENASGPREACGTRTFLALALCMEQQCETPRFRSHAQCDRVREIVERRRLRENGG